MVHPVVPLPGAGSGADIRWAARVSTLKGCTHTVEDPEAMTTEPRNHLSAGQAPDVPFFVGIRPRGKDLLLPNGGARGIDRSATSGSAS